MADNTIIDPGSGGDNIAADELNIVDGVAQTDPKPKAQRFKLGHGADGVFTSVDAAHPFPVALLGSGKTLQFASIDCASSGDNQIVAAAGASTKIYVVSYSLIATADVAAKWRSAANAKSGAMGLKAGGGLAPSGSLATPLLATNANEALNLNLGSAVQVSGHIAYYTGP